MLYRIHTPSEHDRYAGKSIGYICLCEGLIDAYHISERLKQAGIIAEDWIDPNTLRVDALPSNTIGINAVRLTKRRTALSLRDKDVLYFLPISTGIGQKKKEPEYNPFNIPTYISGSISTNYTYTPTISWQTNQPLWSQAATQAQQLNMPLEAVRVEPAPVLTAAGRYPRPDAELPPITDDAIRRAEEILASWAATRNNNNRR